jgi:hypothetical protein
MVYSGQPYVTNQDFKAAERRANQYVQQYKGKTDDKSKALYATAVDIQNQLSASKETIKGGGTSYTLDYLSYKDENGNRIRENDVESWKLDSKKSVKPIEQWNLHEGRLDQLAKGINTNAQGKT